MSCPKGSCYGVSVTERRGGSLARRQEWLGAPQGTRGEALGPTLVSIHSGEESGHGKGAVSPWAGRVEVGRVNWGTPERVHHTHKTQVPCSFALCISSLLEKSYLIITVSLVVFLERKAKDLCLQQSII